MIANDSAGANKLHTLQGFEFLQLGRLIIYLPLRQSSCVLLYGKGGIFQVGLFWVWGFCGFPLPDLVEDKLRGNDISGRGSARGGWGDES